MPNYQKRCKFNMKGFCLHPRIKRYNTTNNTKFVKCDHIIKNIWGINRKCLNWTPRLREKIKHILKRYNI